MNVPDLYSRQRTVPTYRRRGAGRQTVTIDNEFSVIRTTLVTFLQRFNALDAILYSESSERGAISSDSR